MDPSSVVVSLKTLITDFYILGKYTKQAEKQLQDFRNGRNWELCQMILSEQYTQDNETPMVFCAQSCSEFVTRYWLEEPHHLKEQRRNFVWTFLTSRVTGEAAVPFNLINTMINVSPFVIT